MTTPSIILAANTPAIVAVLILLLIAGSAGISKGGRKKWYSYLIIPAALLIGIGGVGMNVTDSAPARLNYEICLAAGIIIYAAFLIIQQRERAEKR